MFSRTRTRLSRLCRTGWAALLCAALAAPAARADDLDDTLDDELGDELELLQDEAVVELPARHRQDIGMSPSAVTVITREDIEASGAVDYADLLRLVPGLDVIRMGRSAMAITGRMYWTWENNHYLVLIDGREANYELLGTTLFEMQPLALEDIERIEVVRGPGSALYGANALAGVVSITTRTLSAGTGGQVRVLGGEAATAELYARGAMQFGDVRLGLTGAIDRGGTFADPDRSGQDVMHLRLVADWQPVEGHRLFLDSAIGHSHEATMPTGIGDISGSLDLRTTRLAYQAERWRAHLYWTEIAVTANFEAPLALGGTTLATLKQTDIDSHVFDADGQLTLPTFWEPLLLIAGANARLGVATSDELLDAAFADPDDARFHVPGIEYWTWRLGAFLHGEWTPVDWVTVTAGARLDANRETGLFLSPRLAAVFSPGEGHFLRLGGARSFRKPAFIETALHFDVDFPADGPIQGTEQDRFREFLAGVISNPDLSNEQVWSFEASYLGRFLDSQLTLAWDLYCNLYLDSITQTVDLRFDGLRIDYANSSLRYEQATPGQEIFGSELSLRLQPLPGLLLQASYTWRYVLEDGEAERSAEHPQHLAFAGGRYLSAQGLVTSLYAFFRSDFTDRVVTESGGLLDPSVRQQMGEELLLLARLGWRFEAGWGSRWEAGLRLQLPIAPGAEAPFRYREKGGFTNPDGTYLGSDELTRQLLFYLQAAL